MVEITFLLVAAGVWCLVCLLVACVAIILRPPKPGRLRWVLGIYSLLQCSAWGCVAGIAVIAPSDASSSVAGLTVSAGLAPGTEKTVHALQLGFLLVEAAAGALLGMLGSALLLFREPQARRVMWGLSVVVGCGALAAVLVVTAPWKRAAHHNPDTLVPVLATVGCYVLGAVWLVFSLAWLRATRFFHGFVTLAVVGAAVGAVVVLLDGAAYAGWVPLAVAGVGRLVDSLVGLPLVLLGVLWLDGRPQYRRKWQQQHVLNPHIHVDVAAGDEPATVDVHNPHKARRAGSPFESTTVEGERRSARKGWGRPTSGDAGVGDVMYGSSGGSSTRSKRSEDSSSRPRPMTTLPPPVQAGGGRAHNPRQPLLEH